MEIYFQLSESTQRKTIIMMMIMKKNENRTERQRQHLQQQQQQQKQHQQKYLLRYWMLCGVCGKQHTIKRSKLRQNDVIVMFVTEVKDVQPCCILLLLNINSFAMFIVVIYRDCVSGTFFFFFFFFFLRRFVCNVLRIDPNFRARCRIIESECTDKTNTMKLPDHALFVCLFVYMFTCLMNFAFLYIHWQTF